MTPRTRHPAVLCPRSPSAARPRPRTRRRSARRSSAAPRAYRGRALPCGAARGAGKRRVLHVTEGRPSRCGGPRSRLRGLRAGRPAHQAGPEPGGRLGPAVRQTDGTLRQYGAVPPQGSPLACGIPAGAGGGQCRARGAAGAKRVPYVTRVENRRPAWAVSTARRWRTRGARAPGCAPWEGGHGRGLRAAGPRGRARRRPGGVCAGPEVRPGRGGGSGGRGGPLVVPGEARDEGGGSPSRSWGFLQGWSAWSRPAGRAAPHRHPAVGEPPFYQGVTVVASVRPGPACAGPGAGGRQPRPVRYFNPLTGGAEGHGWPFGRAVHWWRSSRCSSGPGVEIVDVRLFPGRPGTGRRGEPYRCDRIDLPPGRARLLLRPPGAGAVVTAPPRTSTGPDQPAPARRDPAGALPRRRVRAEPVCEPGRGARPGDQRARLLPGLPRPVDGAAGHGRLAGQLDRPARRAEAAGGAAAPARRASGGPACVAGHPGRRARARRARLQPARRAGGVGGSGWSPNPGTPLPGSEQPGLVVRVRTNLQLDRPDDVGDEDATAPVDEDLLTRLVELVVPAHLPVRIDLMS